MRQCGISTLIAWLSLVAALSAQDPIKDSETGILHKIIVKSDGADLFEALEDVGDADLRLQHLNPFSIRYQFEVDEGDDGTRRRDQNGKKWIRVGRTAAKVDGWVEESQILVWKTRSALRPKGVPGRPFQIFDNPMLEGDALATHLGQGRDHHLSFALILEPAEDSKDPLYKVVFYNGELARQSQDDTSEHPTPSSDPPVEIVFVIDTTASMTPLLDGTKLVASRIANLLGQPGLDKARALMRFGLVEYQDLVFGLTPAAVTIPLTDAASFEKKLKPVTVARISSRDSQEDVIAGLHSAMTEKSIGWTRISSKHLILMGDASAQLPTRTVNGVVTPNPKCTTGLTLEKVIQHARPQLGDGPEAESQKFNLHAIVATNDNDKLDNAVCAMQFSLVSENAGGSFKGVYDRLDATNESERESVIQKLVSTITETAQAIQDSEAFRKRIEGGGSVSPTALAYWKIRPGRAGTGVLNGWCRTRNSKSQEFAEECLFVRYDELRRLKSRLTLLVEEFDLLRERPEERKDSRQLLSTLQGHFGRTHAGQEIVENTRLTDLISGLPLHNDVLATSIIDIAQKDNEQFADWLSEIIVCRDRTEELLSPDGWFVVDEDRNEKYKFLGLRELP